MEPAKIAVLVGAWEESESGWSAVFERGLKSEVEEHGGIFSGR